MKRAAWLVAFSARVLIAQGPTDTSARAAAARTAINAGVAALRAGDTVSAKRDWRRALRDDPSRPEAYANLALVYLAVGHGDSARALAMRGLRHAPDDPRLLTLRGATITGPADLESALVSARAARARHPDDEAIGLAVAGLLSGRDRVAAAALYDTLLRASQPSEIAYHAAAAFWIRGGRYAEAALAADSGLARFPRSGELWLVRGDAAAKSRDWRRAATSYRRAAQRLPAPDAAELRLIDALAADGDTTAAVEVVRRMRSRGASRLVLLAGATRASALGIAPVADSIYRGILAHSPDDASALEGAAMLADSRADTARAVLLYRRELAVDSGGPEAPLALLRLTNPPADQGRELLLAAERRGIAALEGVELQVTAGNATSSADRRAHLDRLVRTILDTVVFQTTWGPDELELLAQAHPQSALIERYVGDLAARRGDLDLALARYDALVRETPADAGLQQGRAALLERMGRSVEARDGYTRAFDLAPEDSVAFRALVRLDEPAALLPDLLAQVERLRLRLPSSRPLAEHQIEVLQRLGRLTEAAAAAHRLSGEHS